jgi:transposase
VVEASEHRQVHDFPPLQVEVVEHQVQTKVCGRCGLKNKSMFPVGVNAPVQYGKGIRAIIAYLLGYQGVMETIRSVFAGPLMMPALRC